MRTYLLRLGGGGESRQRGALDVYVCSPCYSLYLYVERERERYIVVSTEFWLLSISPVERENREQRAERHHSRERERQKDM